jgi:hypothetical protein
VTLTTLLNTSLKLPAARKTSSQSTKDVPHCGRKSVQGTNTPGTESTALAKAS